MTPHRPKVYFRGWPCTVVFGHYLDGGATSIQLYHATEYDLVATATVNLPSAGLEPGEVIIKDWSENEGMVQALVEAGIIGEPTRQIPTGFVEADVCPLLYSGHLN